jgi:hypothetical protein
MVDDFINGTQLCTLKENRAGNKMAQFVIFVKE